jgi:hypothetical protein
MTKVHKISDTTGITTMDVVFVHGINGDPFKTWTGEDDCFWPNWLIEDFPEADLWTVGYDASPTKWIKENLNFLKRAQSVLECLMAKEIGSRPVCFVCHSLGGLVVKQILRQSNENISIGQNGQLFNNTKSVTFFATPHLGSQVADTLSKFRLIRTTKLVNYLKCDEDYITDLHYFIRQTAIPVLSFHETERTPLCKIFSFFKNIPLVNNLLCPVIVPEKSADCGRGGAPSPIEKNHYDICKFKSKEDTHYKTLLIFLRDNLYNESSVSAQDSPVDISEIGKIETIEIEISSSITNGDWKKTKQLIQECETILDNNTQLSNRAEKYLFLADSEKNRVDGLSKTASQMGGYSKLRNLINKAKRANG